MTDLRRFFGKLSPESRLFRFFGDSPNWDAAISGMVDVDDRSRYGIVVLAGADQGIVGHGIYAESGPRKAELALAVADSYQGRGLGTILVGHLAQAANDSGIEVLEAIVKPENHRMLSVLRGSGFPLKTHSEPGEIHVDLPTRLTPEGRRSFEDRERIAAVAAVRHVLEPRSVAVIGASRERGGIGAELFHNLVSTGFRGALYPVNPVATQIEGRPAFASVRDIPGDVEMAVVTVPAAAVVGVAEQCAAKGVRALVVVSAGFVEVGPKGAELQRRLVDVCRRSGMRLVGPNCLGVVNTAPEVRLDATFAPDRPMPGKVAFLSQSGGLGIAVMARAQALGSGLSSFVSVGNRADLSSNDFLQYWELDAATELVMLYLESFGNPRKFARIARRVSRSKPILAVKSGRTQAGTRATSSHTGALLSASDITVDALFEQAGVIRADTLSELFDVALLLDNQILPNGNRVGIITNAGGPAILCADACEAGGLVVPPLPEAVRTKLAGFLPAAASTANPVDMLAAASGEDYRRVMGTLAASDAIDAMIVIFTPPLVTKPADALRAVHRAARKLSRSMPVLTVFMAKESAPGVHPAGCVGVPNYPFPEEAARALSLAAGYSAWRRLPEEHSEVLGGIDDERAAAVIAEALADSSGWMSPGAVEQLLACYSIPVVETHIATSPRDAARKAERIGSAVALKAIAPGLLHKSDAGAVRLNLGGAATIQRAARELATSLKSLGHGVTGYQVQRMADPGVEMLVGVVQDQQFGPVLACAAGGTATELLKDVAIRTTPIARGEAGRMIRSLKTFPLLDGYRGAPRCDVAALEDVLIRVSALVEANSDIVEMDLNPLIVSPNGVLAVDARIRLEPSSPRPLVGAR